jgi:acetolactate synthase II small subunit
MQFRLELRLRPAEGALLRVLGTAERRGFAPVAIEGVTEAGDGQWRLAMTIASTRAPELLTRQLEKLHDCLSVEVVPLEIRSSCP